MADKYSEYFMIDEDFFPNIDVGAIRKSPNLWKKTYPHPTFIKLIEATGRMLGGGIHPIWIHGAYGTGKSQCAYTLAKLLEVSEDELREYWEKFDVLQTNANKGLYDRLLGYKQRKIVVAYRYASGDIDSTRKLLLAVQDSVMEAFTKAGVDYLHGETLRESVIAWLKRPGQKVFFNQLLNNPEYKFTQSTTDEVIQDLSDGKEVDQLMKNIFSVADEEGISAFKFNTDDLIAWLSDIIERNEVKIVFIWDEFSDYFKMSSNSLSEFQKIASMCQNIPFYFCIVTHQTKSVLSITHDDGKKLLDRFEQVELTLPDSIAFDLIGSSLNIRPQAEKKWSKDVDDLFSRVVKSTREVIAQVKRNEPSSYIKGEVMKKLMPLHPYATMVLKYISTAFKSNQRSLFDFIKSPEKEDVRAFQWFIKNTNSSDDHPLLTTDLLWDFFYIKGGSNLTTDIQTLLGTFQQHQHLSDKQKTIFKAILIIQAIDQRTGYQIELFRLTDKNLALVFEGVSDLEGSVAVNIAKQLVRDGKLYKKPIGNGEEVFAVPIGSGSGPEIDNIKKDLRTKSTTSSLIAVGGLASVLPLSAALKLRFDVEPPNGKLIAISYGAEFTKLLTSLRGREFGWQFRAVICFAKEDSEVAPFRKAIKEAVNKEEHNNIVFIDALSTPLGADAYEQYIDYQANANFYSGSDKTLARKYDTDALNILQSDWCSRIKDGSFIIYTFDNKEGERIVNANNVVVALQGIVQRRYPLLFDFNKDIKDPMLVLSQGTMSAKHGILQTSGGTVVNIEKYTLATSTCSVWKIERYWEQPRLESLPISKIKKAIDKQIEEIFKNGNGQISIREIYDMLQREYGFAPCNLTAFIVGFLLKEYCADTYRFIDSIGKPLEASDPAQTLAAMIGDYISCINNNNTKYKDSYIAQMTADERAFYDLTVKAFGISRENCGIVGVVASSIDKKMKDLELPIWVLKEVDEFGVYDVIEMYITLVQKEGSDAQKIAVEIGALAQKKQTLGESLQKLITKENCQSGMRKFLKTFEGGKILDLAQKINADENLISDIRNLFSVERSNWWEKTTGENVLRNLLVEYAITKETNAILDVKANSLKAALEAWCEHLKFLFIPAEILKNKYPALKKAIDYLLLIYKGTVLLPDQLKSLLAELLSNGDNLCNIFKNVRELFADVYSNYLTDLLIEDIEAIYSKLSSGMFSLTASDCNIKVRDTAEKYRQGLLKIKLYELWNKKTDTSNPREWSETYKTPILAMVVDNDYNTTKRVFDVLNQHNPLESAIKDALTYLETASFYDDLKDPKKRDEAFITHIIGDYAEMLKDIEKVRNTLSRVNVDVYDWYSHPEVKRVIERLSEAEYKAGGYDKAITKLREMKPEKRDAYIEELIKANVTVGIAIITSKEKPDDD